MEKQVLSSLQVAQTHTQLWVLKASPSNSGLTPQISIFSQVSLWGQQGWFLDAVKPWRCRVDILWLVWSFEGPSNKNIRTTGCLLVASSQCANLPHFLTAVWRILDCGVNFWTLRRKRKNNTSWIRAKEQREETKFYLKLEHSSVSAVTRLSDRSFLYLHVLSQSLPLKDVSNLKLKSCFCF